MAAEPTISQNKISANDGPSRPPRSHPIASPFDDEIVPEQRPPRLGHWRDQFPPIDYSRWPLKETGDEAWNYWLLAIAGVTFAGAVYGLPFLIFGAIFGLFIAGFFSIVLAAPFAIAVRTLCGRWRHPLAAPCFGGLVGFVSTSAVWEEVWRRDDGFVFFLLGPMTTTLIGQAGGYLMTRRAQAAMLAQRRRSGGWRFSIRTALIATAWTAMTLTLLEILGMTNGRVLAVIALWLPWQIVLLWGWRRLGHRAAAKTAREEGSFT